MEHLPKPRHGHSAVSVDGKVLMAEGRSGNETSTGSSLRMRMRNRNLCEHMASSLR